MKKDMEKKMIFVTGDTHGGIDIKKLNTRRFPESKHMTKTDYVIVAGDFGFLWSNDNEERYWLKWFDKKPFTTLFVDGNHENFDLLNSYPVEQWNGGKIHRINKSVIHLMRGQVYVIDGLRLFTFGGAKSTDIEDRKEGISWWKEEMPSEEEYQEGIHNLEKANWEVDYIITHTCPSEILEKVNLETNYQKDTDEINHYFDSIRSKTTFKHWYFGHGHSDIKIGHEYTLVNEQVIKIK